MILRILALAIAVICLHALLRTDLDKPQRWLVVGLLWGLVIASWDRG